MVFLTGGEHLFVNRGFYEHHFIYLGGGKIVEFNSSSNNKRNAVVRTGSLFRLAKQGDLFFVDYEDSLPANLTIGLALRLKGARNYKLLTNNCEHLATFCKTGFSSSDQVVTASAKIPALAVWGSVAARAALAAPLLAWLSPAVLVGGAIGSVAGILASIGRINSRARPIEVIGKAGPRGVPYVHLR